MNIRNIWTVKKVLLWEFVNSDRNELKLLQGSACQDPGVKGLAVFGAMLGFCFVHAEAFAPEAPELEEKWCRQDRQEQNRWQNGVRNHRPEQPLQFIDTPKGFGSLNNNSSI